MILRSVIAEAGFEGVAPKVYGRRDWDQAPAYRAVDWVLSRAPDLSVYPLAGRCKFGPIRVYKLKPVGQAQKDYRTGTDVDLLALGECAVYLRAIAWRMKGMATLLQRWEDVTHDVEWWASGDYGVEAVVDEFKKLMASRSTPSESLDQRDPGAT